MILSWNRRKISNQVNELKRRYLKVQLVEKLELKSSTCCKLIKALTAMSISLECHTVSTMCFVLIGEREHNEGS